MKKLNVVTFVILSTIVVLAWFVFRSKPSPSQSQPQSTPSSITTTSSPATATTSETPGAPTAVKSVISPTISAGQVSSELVSKTVSYRSPLISTTLSTRGGLMTSYSVLNEPSAGGGRADVALILKDKSLGQDSFFAQSLGNHSTAQDLFFVKSAGTSFTFYRTYQVLLTDGSYRDVLFEKKYKFSPKEYAFKLTTSLTSLDEKALPLSKYSLETGKQIGPLFKVHKGRNIYGDGRLFSYSDDFKRGKRRQVRIPRHGDSATLTQNLLWLSISGKYFSLIAMPQTQSYAYTVTDQKDLTQNTQISKINFKRGDLGGTYKINDSIVFYFGPRTRKTLAIYDKSSTNSFGLMGYHLTNELRQSLWLYPLRKLFKWFLGVGYKVVPNYGVVIIIMTLLIKLILYPITRSSYRSTAKMQAIQPKMQELREKYKNDPRELNVAMSRMYKDEGVNPLGGCLPLLFQFPILIALFQLFNSDFGLRGAMFIPHWIPDLSVPDSIWHMSFALPILGWTDLRLLPIIYVASQIVMMKVSQTNTSGQQNSGMQKSFMLMPVVFFFILYNASSALFVYWNTTNIITIFQQREANRMLKNGKLQTKKRHKSSRKSLMQRISESQKQLSSNNRSGRGKRN